ncbi:MULTISPECIES: glutaminase [unclassified Agrococcus]|uniref:glutaminase n=1 Tax=unclassified Agrococcus TaxID=2615065 RepID=UPI003606039D
MRSPLPDYLTEVLEACTEDDGELAAYIPELADADPSRLALALATPDGTRYAVGDAEVRFTIQSISKPFAYALALVDHGLEAVLEHVGVEPSGDAFNEISLDPVTNRPLNPMINAGAITVHSLLDVDRVSAGFAAFAGRELEVDEDVYRSELDSADRNHAIAYMLRNHGIIDADPHAVVDGYTRQCSMLVDVGDLAMMAATLANAGTHPVTGEQVVPRWVARQTLSVMTTCGMYDAAGDWFTLVGIPAKSGVSGGVIGALPGKGGFAAFSPRLDAHGNSTRGVRIFERLSDDMAMHLMEVPPAARPLTHGHAAQDGDGDGDVDSIYELQGAVDFVGMERLLAELEHEEEGEREIVLDLGRVHEVRDVGRRMLLEGARRLGLDGHRIVFVDPDDLLETGDAGTIDVGDGPEARVVRRR